MAAENSLVKSQQRRVSPLASRYIRNIEPYLYAQVQHDLLVPVNYCVRQAEVGYAVP